MNKLFLVNLIEIFFNVFMLRIICNYTRKSMKINSVYHHTHWRYDTHIVGPYDQYDRYIAVSLHLYQSNILITANDDNEYLMRVNTLYS